jgi:hypothetical protein
MVRTKKGAQPGKNAAAEKGKIASDISEDSNKPLFLLLVPYYVDVDEDCFKMDDDAPYHASPVSLLGRPKRHNGRPFADHKDGEISLALYASALTSSSSKVLPPALKKECESNRSRYLIIGYHVTGRGLIE